MRHEIGVETIAFGRDYPHPEGTWPHTKQWLQDAFAGVPEQELRLMLGENAIRFFGLDRARLAEYAKRIGFTVGEITGGEPVRQDPSTASRWRWVPEAGRALRAPTRSTICSRRTSRWSPESEPRGAT
jgi:hypothetical protein